MNLEAGKTYLTKHGRFVKLDHQPWEGIFNGDYEQDGRNGGFGNDCGRWKSDGKAWNFFFPSYEFYTPEHNIIMEDCEEARTIAAQMKLERKQKAYEETN